ncbi:TLC domain-containing protein 5-like [Ptychodera flava]|uniref:TLC domain-containing protein 5-like n=1 Tax=Ptychodera flava TaxID=63121 RepID=UPI00396A63C6
MEFDRHVLIPASMSAFLMWYSLYNVFCLVFPAKSYEWNCRFVTLIHATITTILSWIWGVYYNPWVFTDPGGENNAREILVCTICLGYFLFDFMWCLWFYDPNEKVMLLHHFFTIGGILLIMNTGHGGTELNATIFGSEVSNPFLQARWFMRDAGYDKTWIYEINDLLFMVIFFVCRICVGTYLMYTEWSHPRPSLGVKLGGTAIYLVSVVFMYNIAMFAFKKYTRMYRAWKNRLKMVNGTLSNGRIEKKVQ